MAWLFNRRRIEVEYVTPPRDVVAADVVALGTSAEAQIATLLSRFDEVARVVRVALDEQSELVADDRNDQLVDLALEVRTALGRSVPVTAGGSS